MLERSQRLNRLVQFQIGERQVDEFPGCFRVDSLGLNVVRVKAVAFHEEDDPLRRRLPGLFSREPLQERLQHDGPRAKRYAFQDRSAIELVRCDHLE